MSEINRYTFIPSMRTGLAAYISGQDNNRGTTKIQLNLKARKKGSSTEQSFPVIKDLSVYGPGDILGFDPGIVIRTDPKDHVGDFEPNYFPMIEFADPDFPWRFSLPSSDTVKLNPWITLVVLVAEPNEREFEDKSYVEKGRVVPKIRVTSESALPDFSTAWRWAHVQLINDKQDGVFDFSELSGLWSDSPECFVSRLMCARKLEPGKLYNAFVVPTYEVGRRAALGLSFEGINPEAPWIPEAPWFNDPNELVLPYYFKWEFRTGRRGDFEHLVRLLEPRPLSNLGLRDVDCSRPGLGVRVSGSQVENVGKLFLKMEGALESPETKYSNWGHDREDTTEPEAFQKDIAEKVLNRNTAFLDGYYLKIDQGVYGSLEGLTIRPGVPKGKSNVIEKERYVIIELKHSVKCTVAIEYQMYKDDEAEGDPKTIDIDNLKADHIIELEFPRLNRAYKLNLLLTGEDGSKLPIKDLSIDIPLMPYVTPPMYGSRHKLANEVQPEEKDWFNTINCDPRHRMAAGLGSQFVKKEQEALMSSAWEQLGEVLKANALLQRAQLSRAASKNIEGKLSKVKEHDEELYLKLTGPLFKHLAATFPQADSSQPEKTRTIYHHLHESSHVPVHAIGSAYHRLSTRGSLQKKHAVLTGNTFRKLMEKPDTLLKPKINLKGTIQFSTIGAIASNQYSIDNPLTAPSDGMIPDDNTVDGSGSGNISDELNQNWLRITQVINDLKFIKVSNFNITNFDLGRISVVLGGYTTWTKYFDESQIDISKLRTRLQVINAAEFEHAVQWLNPTAGFSEKPVIENILEQVKQKVQELIKPDKTIKDLIWGTEIGTGRIRLPERIQKTPEELDDFSPIMAAPHFDQPLYKHLLELSQDYLLPGVERIEQNTIGLLATNGRFIESFLVGCNHEFAGELLWRKYPTDQRGTYFRQFWDRSIELDEDENEDPEKEIKVHPDIKDIHLWNNKKLGENSPQDTGKIVLIIRGNLLKKYPNTIIYAAGIKDVDDDKDPVDWTSITLPEFIGQIPPDITFLGFPFNETEAKNKFFVIEEVVSETRFGLDETPSGDLSWENVSLDDGKYVISIDNNNNLNSDFHSAQIAAKTFQKPVRVVIHGSKLLL